MIVSTPGIVMHATKYGDTSLIVKIFTQQQGNQSFIIKNAFRKNNRFAASYFTPLAMMDISYDDHSKSSLKYLKDIAPHRSSNPLYYDPAKSSILLFYNEILYKMLMDSGEDEVLFDFLQEEIGKVHNATENLAELRRFQHFFVEDAGFLTASESRYLHQLLSQHAPVTASRGLRVALLKQLVSYFQMHNEQIHKIDSLEILSAVLH